MAFRPLPAALAAGLLAALPGTAAAQSSTARVKADPKAAYALVKRLIPEVPDVAARLKDPEAARDGTSKWSYGCPIVTLPTGSGADGFDLLVDVGLLSVLHRAEIVKLGYPKKEVDRIMDGVEAKLLAGAVAEIQGKAEASSYYGVRQKSEWPTVAAFARVRSGSKGRMTPIVVPEECFDEGFEKAIRSRPEGGSLQLLPDFAARFCKAQGLDPGDPAACDRWSDATVEASAGHWGEHRYRITWPDGREATGHVRIEIDQEDTAFVPPR